VELSINTMYELIDVFDAFKRVVVVYCVLLIHQYLCIVPGGIEHQHYV